jgi:hypothetical protein
VSLSINLAAHSDLFQDNKAERCNAEWNDDELRILLSIRLHTPLSYYVEGIMEPIGSESTSRVTESGFKRPSRPLCLLSFLAANPDETPRCNTPDRAAVFQKIKESAKWGHHQSKYAIPQKISKLTYILAIVLALVACGVRISELGNEDLVKNLRWMLSRRWLDERLRPQIERGLQLLGAPQSARVSWRIG